MGTRTKRGSLHASNLSHLACLPHRAVSAPRPRATTNDDETPLPTSPTNEPPLAANIDSNTLSRANERTTKRTTDRRLKPQNLKPHQGSETRLFFQHSNSNTTTSPMFDRRSPPITPLSSTFLPPRLRRHPSAVYCSSCAKSVLAVDNRTLGPPSHQRYETDASMTGLGALSRALMDFPFCPSILPRRRSNVALCPEVPGDSFGKSSRILCPSRPLSPLPQMHIPCPIPPAHSNSFLSRP
ncbi:hypothetical protein BKA81DRAFT_156579 [Phyllosticta paracitricarpa]|uniref:Uncharacterized protein n=1 Tax=Phyllosticta paracitricarpa TaxID=2016321 RepID=A0ABR1NEG9_9PEZI